jgi:hypothetical protein
MKNYSQFIKEEVSIQGNKGIPPEKLREIEAKGAEKIRGAQIHQLGPRMGQLMMQSAPFIRGNQKALEELAVKVIRDTFGIVLANVDIQADLVDNGNKIAQFMKKEDEEKKKEAEEAEEEEENDDDNNQPQEEEKLDPEAVKSAVDLRKIMNNIIQGEAKNTKHMLHTDEVKNGLKKIYGEPRWQQAFNIWDELTKTADKMDWLIPIEHRARMMEQQPGGMAGCVSCRFPKKKKKKKSKQEDEGKEEQKPNAVTKPTIKVKAVDFPMLLHELVKGVYEMISHLALPQDQKLRSEVFKQTSSYADEVEDWRYGTYLAEDLNNFIMKSPKIGTYPNIKEYVFGALIDKKRFTDDQILLNLKNIFLESPEGIRLRDQLVDEVIAKLKSYYDQLEEYNRRKEEREREEREAEEFAKQAGKEEEESDIDKLVKQSLYGEKEEPKGPKKSYDQMSMDEIQSEIDKAVEEENYELAAELTNKFLKGESKKVWTNELNRIFESKKYRSRK